MKEEYLWDKTGNDPEIERLEGLLSEFRYSEAARTESNIVEFPSRSKTVLQPWAFAMAACLAVGAIAIGVWNLANPGSDATPVQTAQVATQAPLMAEPGVVGPIVESDMHSPSIDVPRPVAVVKRSRTTPRPKYTAVIRKRRDSSDTINLTKEEKYAYGQLLLALSITSSKLQIVTDSINGVDEIKTNER